MEQLPPEQEWARAEDLFSTILAREQQFTYGTTSLQEYPSGILNLGLQWWPLNSYFTFPSLAQRPSPPSLTATRSLISSGQEQGEIVLRIRNNDAFNERHVRYSESLPWLLQPALHTLRINVEAHAATSDEEGAPVYFRDELESPFLLALAHQPSLPRKRAFLLEADLRIPRDSTLVLTYKVKKAFLRYTEHLPDAHRGFDLPPAVITPLAHPDELTPLEPARIYTQPALLEAAVPDFSMPYNVIIMTSTIIALFFGSVFNNLTRKYQDVVL